MKGAELADALGESRVVLGSLNPDADVFLPLQQVVSQVPAHVFGDNGKKSPDPTPRKQIETPFSRLTENDPANGGNLTNRQLAPPKRVEHNPFAAKPKPKPKPKAKPVLGLKQADPRDKSLAAAKPAKPAAEEKKVNGTKSSSNKPHMMEAVGGMFDLGANLKQLELRAIFNTDAVLDVPEIIERTGRMDTIMGCILMHQDGDTCQSQSVDSPELEAFFREAPAFHANMKRMTEDLGIGNAESFSVNTEKGMISFFSKEKICLGVLHEGCSVAPGTRERLILVTRELAKMMA